MSALKCLLNQTIQKAEKMHDYVQLFFDNSAILNIYCRLSINGVDENIANIAGLKVIETLEKPNEVSLMLTDKQQIDIRYNDDDYSGPEALELINPSGNIVIWP